MYSICDLFLILIYTVFLCAFKSKSTPNASGPYIDRAIPTKDHTVFVHKLIYTYIWYSVACAPPPLHGSC